MFFFLSPKSWVLRSQINDQRDKGFNYLCNCIGEGGDKLLVIDTYFPSLASHIGSPANRVPFTLVMWQLATNGRTRWALTRGSYGWCNRYNCRWWNRSSFLVNTGADRLIYEHRTFSVSTEMQIYFLYTLQSGVFPYYESVCMNVGLLIYDSLNQRQFQQ